MKNLLNERKFKVQQSIIEELKAENQKLKQELEEAKSELEFEKTFKDKEYDDLKELFIDLNEKKSIYEDLIQKAIYARKEYKEKIKELNELKVELNKEFKKFMKDIKSI